MKISGNSNVKSIGLFDSDNSKKKNLHKELLGTSIHTFAAQHPNYKPDVSAGAHMG